MTSFVGSGLTRVLLAAFFGCGSVAAVRADFLVADSGANSVLRYNSVSGTYSTLISGDPDLVGPTGLAIDAGGDLLVSSRDLNTIRRYNIVTGSFINQFAIAAPLPTDIRFRANGNLLAGKLVGPALEQFAPDGTSLGDFTSGSPLIGNASFTWGPDGDLYVGSFGDLFNEGAGGSIKVFDSTTGVFKRELTVPFKGASALLFDNNGDLWATSVYENRVIRLNPSGAGAILSEFTPGAFTFPQSMVLSPYGANELLVGLGGPGIGAPGVYRFDFAGNNLGLVGSPLALPGHFLLLPVPEPSTGGILLLVPVAAASLRRRQRFPA